MKRFVAFRNILVEKWIKIWSGFDLKPIMSAFTAIDLLDVKKQFCDNSLPTALPPYYVTITKNLNKI